MSEMKSLTLNGQTYDSFVDTTARALSVGSAIIGSASGENITVHDASNYNLLELHLYGKTTQDGTPMPDAPVELVSAGDDGDLGVEVFCKNLLNIKSGTVDGFTVTNTGGAIAISGTNPNNYAMRVKLCDVKINAGVRYCLSGGLSSNNALVVSKTINTFEIQSEGTYGVYTATEDVIMGVYLRVADGQVLSNYTIYPQLEVGSTPTAYEPYIGQSMAVATHNGLTGIPVTSGGNYTDASGQQWICDEIDLKNAKLIQRCGHYVFNGSEQWEPVVMYVGNSTIPYTTTQIARSARQYDTHIICNIGKGQSWTEPPYSLFINEYSRFVVGGDALRGATNLNEFKALIANNPIELVYKLETPIERDLSEEELAAYADLHTYRDSTTVSNDAGAYMELEYVMDAKKYIDSLLNAPPAKITTVSLKASKWTGADSLYSQVVTIDGITPYSKVDLLPSVEQLAIFHNKDVAFVTENEDGVVTVYAIGDKPTLDYTMQAQITEVIV